MFSCPMLPADPAAAVLELFSTDLVNVQFPDVGQASLEAAHDAVKQAQAELAEAEALLEAAHQSLLAKQDELAHKASRALAYARIYAESDEALAEKVRAIAALPGLAPRGLRKGFEAPQGNAALAPKKRGRPPKAQAGQATLPAQDLAVDAAAE